MKVEVLCTASPGTLQREINNFLVSIDIKIIDIEFSSFADEHSNYFSALIIYEDNSKTKQK